MIDMKRWQSEGEKGKEENKYGNRRVDVKSARYMSSYTYFVVHLGDGWLSFVAS